MNIDDYSKNELIVELKKRRDIEVLTGFKSLKLNDKKYIMGVAKYLNRGGKCNC